MSQGIEKLGTDKVAAVAARAARISHALADENDTLRAENQRLRDKVASYERADRVRDLASQMEDKGLNADLTFEEKVASISGYNDLDQVEQAIKLAGAGSIHLPEITDDVPGRTADSKDAFHSFLVHGQGS